jgi:non-heme chloroperoxidase
MGRLEVDGSRSVYYEHHHRGGSGRPVVLVHGAWATAHSWDTVLPALLAAGHEVALLELRGCGRSDKDFGDMSIEALGRDVAALVRHLGLRRPVLNGWSMGGAVVIAAAAELGDDVGGVVLTGGATPRYTSADDWPYGGTAADVEAVLGGLAVDRAGTFRGVAGAVCAKPVGDDVVNAMWGEFMQSSPRADESLRSLAALDQRAAIASLRCPVLLLAGKDDGFVAFDAIAASKELFGGQTRLVEFGGVGHAPFLEDGNTYRAELAAFLDGLA